DHDVDLEILERRIENLLDDRCQAMDLVDEQNVVLLEVAEQRREISRALEHWAAGLPQPDAHFMRDDVRQRGLAEPWWTEQQQMIERFAAATRSGDEDVELLADLRLTDVVGKTLRAQRAFDHFLVRRGLGCSDQAVFAHAQSVTAWRA